MSKASFPPKPTVRTAAEARSERAIHRVLTALSVDASASNPRHAIFRVIAAGEQFEFTRTLMPGGEQAIERFGPYTTQRAAHELAQRAATRFRADNPHCVVGVVDLEPDPAALPPRPLWEVIAERRDEARREWHRRRYAKRVSTLEGRARMRERDRKRAERAKATPEGRERLREKWRKRQARLAATPEGREQQRKHERAWYAREVSTPEGRERQREKGRKNARLASPAITCTDGQDDAVPACIVCGNPTRYYQGKPVRFCPKPSAGQRSACQVRHTNKLRTERVKNDPELRLKHNRKQREWNHNNPEKRRIKLIKDQETRRNNPRRYAAQLAAERERKARRRAEAKAARPSDLPTGSVLVTASPRTPGRDLLASVYGAVPSHLPPSLRSEIISETTVLVLEGAELSAAVAQATKSVRRNAAPLRYTKPIEDCFWLADETSLIAEASL